jgi:hypothetical protein
MDARKQPTTSSTDSVDKKYPPTALFYEFSRAKASLLIGSKDAVRKIKQLSGKQTKT